MAFPYSLQELLSIVGDAQISGSAEGLITGLAPLKEARSGELSFMAGPRYLRDLLQSQASAVLVPKDLDLPAKQGQVLIHVESPSLALAQFCGFVERDLFPIPEPGIHATAIVDPSAEIGNNVHIGPFCVIGAHSTVGDNCMLAGHVWVGNTCSIGAGTRLGHRVTLEAYTRIGKNCVLHAGVVLGADGFGYDSGPGGHRKIPQIGKVVIEDDVEIGANTTIDRARFAQTVIGKGSKIDNLVQVGHNVVIGKHCIVCAQTGIAGSTTIGDFVVFAGQVGIGGHLHIASGVQVAAQAGVGKSLPAKAVVTGTPARDFHAQRKLQALMGYLPEMRQQLRALSKQISGVDATPSSQD